ncbi:hypothetical protein C8R44DRAFT_863494 [Mycena epipterygia]|nr:hypothetical protein C8R44DRAFT_863494 [Mycena epipterygia]
MDLWPVNIQLPGSASTSRRIVFFRVEHLPGQHNISSSSSVSTSSSGVAKCVPTDDAGSALQSSSVTSDGFMAYEYQAAGDFQYFAVGGSFSSGSSTCPDSITSASSSSAAAGASGENVGSFLADNTNAGTNGGSGSGLGGNIPEPVVIALLVMNGVLVLGALILGTLWVRDGRVSTKPKHLKGLYARVDPSYVVRVLFEILAFS